MAYYVSVKSAKDPGAFVLAAGPFNRLGDAHRYTYRVRCAVSDRFPRESWDALVGTCRVKSGPLPIGRFNDVVGLPTAGRIARLPVVRTSINRRVFAHGTGFTGRNGFVQCNDPNCLDDDVMPHGHPITREEINDVGF